MDLKTIIAFLGLTSFVCMFIGTAVCILFFGWALAGKVAIASMIMFVFLAIITNLFWGGE